LKEREQPAVKHDGEAVVLGVDGVSDFDAPQSRRHDDEVQLYAFDMLAGDGDDYSQNDGATISWSVERLLEGFDMSRRPLLFCRGAILLAACRAAPAFNSPYRRSQTLRRDAALVSRPKEQATRPRILLWVNRVVPTGRQSLSR
jgi:hypothetical protein